MTDDRSLLERELQRLELRPFTLEGFRRRREREQRNRRIRAGLLALLVTVVTAAALVGAFSTGPLPAGDRSLFLGIWVSDDDDGSTQTMTVRPSDDAVAIAVYDDSAPQCSGAPSTMTGTGRIEGGSQLVIPVPMFTCDDGSEPEVPSGPPVEEQLRDLTFVHDAESDVLTDSFGSVWNRLEGDDPSPGPPEGLDGQPLWGPSSFPGIWGSTAADTGFVGTWESTDVDGSSLLLGVRVSEDPSDTVEVLLLDDRGVCYSPDAAGPTTMTGIGRIGGPELAVGSQTWICEAEPGEPGPYVVSGDRSIELADAHAPLVHDPETDTLVGPTGVVWHRRPPGSDPIAVPFWGVWPQTSLEEVEEAQRRADGGDPAFTWQLAPELTTPPESEAIPIPAEDAKEGAEILTRFFRDDLGWERYVTVARRNPWWNGDPGWTFVRIRCGPGTNPLYPNDPNGGDCPPTIGDTHYETVWLMVTQPVRSGPSGIWVVTDWSELAPSEEPASELRYHEWVGRQYEQVVPPTQAELMEGLEAFLSARVAGEGAESYLTEGYYSPRPKVPLLYATTEGHRYERFEIGSVEGPRWPAGVYAVTVRLFARGGTDVVKQSFAVWPGARGQLTMDTWGRGGTTENGEPVPDGFGSEE